MVATANRFHDGGTGKEWVRGGQSGREDTRVAVAEGGVERSGKKWKEVVGTARHYCTRPQPVKLLQRVKVQLPYLSTPALPMPCPGDEAVTVCGMAYPS
jgi:hypothetical protein